MASAAHPGQDRVALVTGSTSGIGLAIARRLARDGFVVALHSRASAESGRALAAELGKASYTQADLADEAEARRLIRDVVARHGRLDVLVNNAGISQVIPHGALQEATPAIWRTLYDVNVIAPFVLVAEAETALRRSAEEGRPAAIVNISSHAGVRPKGASIPYAASKAALNHVTRLLAATLAPAIRVNAIAPGLVDTPLTASWTAAQDLWRTRAPMRRAATPDDIADIAAMVIATDYLTGEVIIADGGLNLT
jgi:NAD(P)-dependent dehydrogenase (short-subunit alcohol dehydrogenase family)